MTPQDGRLVTAHVELQNQQDDVVCKRHRECLIGSPLNLVFMACLEDFFKESPGYGDFVWVIDYIRIEPCHTIRPLTHVTMGAPCVIYGHATHSEVYIEAAGVQGGVHRGSPTLGLQLAHSEVYIEAEAVWWKAPTQNNTFMTITQETMQYW